MKYYLQVSYITIYEQNFIFLRRYNKATFEGPIHWMLLT